MLLCQTACRLPALCTLAIAHCSLALPVWAWPSPGTSALGALCLLFMCLSQQSCTMDPQLQLLTTGTRSSEKLAGSCPCIRGLHAALHSLQHSNRKDVCRGLGELELPECTAACRESALNPAPLRPPEACRTGAGWQVDTPGAYHHWQVPVLGRKDQEVNIYVQ